MNTENTRNAIWKEWLLIVAGVITILMGVVVNIWTAERLLTQDGDLSLAGDIIIWLFDIITISIGFALIFYRKRVAAHLYISKKTLLASILSILLLFAALEVAARVIDLVYEGNFSSERERLSGGSIIPYRIFGFSQYEHTNGELMIVDSRGNHFSLEKPKNGIRIVAFGGSTTHQSAPGTTHYPRLLEDRLNEFYEGLSIEVINVGNVGYATSHSLTLLMLDVLSWDPDIIIVSHNINDLVAAYTPGFTPDYSHVFSLPVYIRGKTAQDKILQTFFGWSTLYWTVRHQVGSIGLPLIKEALRGEAYTRTSYGFIPPENASDVFYRNLKTFAEIARSNNISVIFGTQPFQPSLEYWDRTMRFYLTNDIIVYPLHEELVAHHEYYNDIIRDVAEREGAHLVDSAILFGGKEEYFYDHVHYTKMGLEKLAQHYFDYIVSRGLIR